VAEGMAREYTWEPAISAVVVSNERTLFFALRLGDGVNERRLSAFSR